MSIPKRVADSGTFSRLNQDRKLTSAITSLRSIAEKLASCVSSTVPGFTDHSIGHMDALWEVADQILTPKEIELLSVGEAFLLGCAFYLHDIGMAYAATDEGLARCQNSPSYKANIDSFLKSGSNTKDAESKALALAVRTLHANAAEELAINPVPGTQIYLFESLEIRESWGQTCGQVAASHHWDIEEIENTLGRCGVVPLAGGLKGDLGYVAAILRLVDYAHINRERAGTIERAFRNRLSDDSLIHWLAQENIDGPAREDNELVYRAARPISNVDAWWLYYSMLSGLDAEIRQVRKYLDRRVTSRGRFSLQSVRGASTPQEVSTYIPTNGFLPIEVNLKTGSINRLVELLAGESLYGPDPMAAVRELVQNARDAVMLKIVTAKSEIDKASATIPIKVAIGTQSNSDFLEVKDWGVGMTPKIITDFLISIASDYWTSQFHLDFPNAASNGFRPAGKFGIGFLSVFMLGDDVSIESSRAGGERSQLLLHGVGRRGELRTLEAQPGSGTAIRVHLKPGILSKLRPLPELLRIYVPLLSHVIEIDDDGKLDVIKPGWLFELPVAEFKSWILRAISTLQRYRGKRFSEEEGLFVSRYYRQSGEVSDGWPDKNPEYIDDNTRLLASFEGVSLMCLKGLSLQMVRTPGFVGIINIDTAVPDVSRREAIQSSLRDDLDKIKLAISPEIVTNLNSLSKGGFIGDKLEFLSKCATFYGEQVLFESSIPWISRIKLPGEVELLNSATFLKEVSSKSSIFLAFDTGPWTALRKWTETGNFPSTDEFAIVLDGVGYPRPGYSKGDDVIIGKLNTLWSECLESPLLGAVFRLIAEAWQSNVEFLVSQDGWHHKGSTIWGRVSRL